MVDDISLSQAYNKTVGGLCLQSFCFIKPKVRLMML